MRWIVILLLAASASPALAADGSALFDQQCASCHTLTDASNDLAPTLKGVVWRPLAVLRDFNYSGALKRKGGSWSPDRLDDFLKDSQAFAPGNGMYFALTDPADRKAIVDYLKAQSPGR